MKKSVIITIVAIYIISIFVVAVFGVNASLDYQKVYVTDIDGSNTEGYVKYSPQEADEKGCTGYITINEYKKDMKIPLDFRPIPGNADEKKLKYEVATNSQKYCEITPNPDGTATLTIKEQQTLTIYIRAQDSQGCYITIRINMNNPDWEN